MALTNIEYGSIATSKVLNDNFNYLEDKIEDYSKNISSNNASLTSLVNSQVATVANNLNNKTTELQNNINKVQKNLDNSNSTFSSTPHVTEHKATSTGWVRVWSNGFKEETGYASVGADGDKTITFTYAFSNNKFSTFATFRERIQTGGTDNGCAFYPTGTKTANLVNSLPYSATLTWYANGF